MLVLLTGVFGAGKSTVCARVARQARLAGRNVGGVLALASCDAAGAKSGIELLDLATGQRRLQASTVADLGGICIGRFSMDDTTLAWGADVILRAIEAGCDLVIIDEIGPLELMQGVGLVAALPALLAHPEVPALVVVRSELVEEAVRRLAARSPFVSTVTSENRDAMPARLEHTLWPA